MYLPSCTLWLFQLSTCNYMHFTIKYCPNYTFVSFIHVAFDSLCNCSCPNTQSLLFIQIVKRSSCKCSISIRFVQLPFSNHCSNSQPILSYKHITQIQYVTLNSIVATHLFQFSIRFQFIHVAHDFSTTLICDLQFDFQNTCCNQSTKTLHNRHM